MNRYYPPLYTKSSVCIIPFGNAQLLNILQYNVNKSNLKRFVTSQKTLANISCFTGENTRSENSAHLKIAIRNHHKIATVLIWFYIVIPDVFNAPRSIEIFLVFFIKPGSVNLVKIVLIDFLIFSICLAHFLIAIHQPFDVADIGKQIKFFGCRNSFHLYISLLLTKSNGLFLSAYNPLILLEK